MKTIFYGLILFFFTLNLIPSAYSWDGNEMDEENRVMIVNESFRENDSLNLIPLTAIEKANDTKYLTFRYEVEVSKNYDFSASIDQIYVNNSNEYSDELLELFVVDIMFSKVEDTGLKSLVDFNGQDTETYNVFVILTMNEPEDYDQYKLITSNNISLDFVFVAV